MLYSEIKTFLKPYLTKPLPLYGDGWFTPDARKSIELHFYMVENNDKMKIKRVYKNNLLRYVDAIKCKQFDIKGKKKAYFCK